MELPGTADIAFVDFFFFLFLLIFVPRYVNNDVDLFSRSSVTYLLMFFSNSERIILLCNERFFHESFVYLSELAQGAGKQTFLLTLTKKQTNKQKPLTVNRKISLANRFIIYIDHIAEYRIQKMEYEEKRIREVFEQGFRTRD